MADLHEKFEMSERDQDGIYMNQSSKYLTFDENGRPIEGVNDTPTYQNVGGSTEGAVAYAVISLPTSDNNMPGVAYAKPSKQNVTKVDIEDNEKYHRLDDIVEKGAVVPHNITPSGVAYALPNKSGTSQTQIPEEDDDKYMTLNSIDVAVTQDPDPDDGQAYHAYENPDPPDPDVIVPEQRSSKDSRKRKVGLITIISFLVLIVVGLGIAVVKIALKNKRDSNQDMRGSNQNTQPSLPGHQIDPAPLSPPVRHIIEQNKCKKAKENGKGEGWFAGEWFEFEWFFSEGIQYWVTSTYQNNSWDSYNKFCNQNGMQLIDRAGVDLLMVEFKNPPSPLQPMWQSVQKKRYWLRSNDGTNDEKCSRIKFQQYTHNMNLTDGGTDYCYNVVHEAVHGICIMDCDKYQLNKVELNLVVS